MDLVYRGVVRPKEGKRVVYVGGYSFYRGEVWPKEGARKCR